MSSRRRKLERRRRRRRFMSDQVVRCELCKSVRNTLALTTRRVDGLGGCVLIGAAVRFSGRAYERD